MLKNWLPTIVVAVMVGVGAWLARDYATPHGTETAQSPSAENAPSVIAIPPDANDTDGGKQDLAANDTGHQGDFQQPAKDQDMSWKKVGSPSMFSGDLNAKPLGEVDLPQEEVAAASPPATVQADLRTEIESIPTTPPQQLSAPRAQKIKKGKKEQAKKTPQVPTIKLPASYLTQQNDSFWRIAKKHYGNPLFYRALYEFNRRNFPRPDRISAGTLVTVPTKAELRSRFPSMCPK